jgi:hypothetical protein
LKDFFLLDALLRNLGCLIGSALVRGTKDALLGFLAN